jgi:hypothetical protein
MFDETYCARTTQGPPEISIEGMNELSAVLASLAKNRKGGGRSRPSEEEAKCLRRRKYRDRHSSFSNWNASPDFS